MDWNVAIDIHREALRRILAVLVAMAGLPVLHARGVTGANGGVTLPRQLHRAVLALLRPTEAAARRLVVVAARGLVVVLPAPPQARKPKPTILRKGVGAGIAVPPSLIPPPLTPQGGGVRGGGKTEPAYRPGKVNDPCAMPPRLGFPLFDPLPPWNRRVSHAAVPRICVPGFNAPFPVALPAPHDPIGAARLALRIQALGAVLEDLPRHALRLARLRQARMRLPAGFAGPRRRTWPLRPGRPPGHLSQRSRRSAHEVHAVLGDLHGLAVWALADTS